MSGESLNFFGGLFVFLAGLTPIVRAMWRKAAAHDALRAVGALVCVIVAGALLSVACAGSIVGIHLSTDADFVLLLLSALAYLAGFVTDDRPIKRTDVALLSLMLMIIASLLGLEFSVMVSTSAVKKLGEKPPADVSHAH